MLLVLGQAATVLAAAMVVTARAAREPVQPVKRATARAGARKQVSLAEISPHRRRARNRAHLRGRSERRNGGDWAAHPNSGADARATGSASCIGRRSAAAAAVQPAAAAHYQGAAVRPGAVRVRRGLRGSSGGSEWGRFPIRLAVRGHAQHQVRPRWRQERRPENYSTDRKPSEDSPPFAPTWGLPDATAKRRRLCPPDSRGLLPGGEAGHSAGKRGEHCGRRSCASRKTRPPRLRISWGRSGSTWSGWGIAGQKAY